MYRFFHDPGHGWLEVQLSELIELGIENQITACSYQNTNGGHISMPSNQKEFIPRVYLEEDSDAPKFLTAKFGDGPYPKFVEIYHEDDRIRCLDSYNPHRLKRWLGYRRGEGGGNA